MRVHDLIAHKGYADAELLNAIWQHHSAASDTLLRALLHHMLVANRFWLLSIVGERFLSDVEPRLPDSIESLVDGFRTTHDRESAWLRSATAETLGKTMEGALIPGGRCLVSDALLQVCLHSQGHRAQCAKMFRALGGSPPAMDFILWVVERPAPNWPA